MPKTDRHREPWSMAGRLSARVLAVLIALAAVLFGAFFAVGYDMPFADDPQFNAPLLTDGLLWFTYVLCAVAAVVATVSAIHALRVRSSSACGANLVPAGRIAAFAVGLTAVSLVATFALGSTEPVMVNGTMFDDALWLRLTDMFINTAIVLAIVAIAAVAVGVAGWQRNMGNKRKTTGR